ncbi:helix-turn-helix domain-containing protein [Arthrobacter sp. 35W]|uniref:helix-turn-helix domain-containing protein n=1 Tax=Arthrobacter sp. 35W TaxID=1132441 RepID=UPI0004186DA1|nr:AraC family transcriptional regulator [Arthrobacter sp. 35W]
MEPWALYRNPARTLHELGVAALGAGEQEGRLPSFSRRTLPSHALVIVSEGSGWLLYGGVRHTVTAPAVIWIFPGVEHGYGPGPEGWREHWLLFTGPGARAFEELGCFSRSQPLAALSAGYRPPSGFAELRRTLALEGPRGDLESSVAAQQIMLDAGRHSHQPAIDAADALLGRLRELAYLSLSAAQQAARLGLTPSALREAVQAGAGVGPKEFVLQLRMSRAQALLAGTAYPIERIARLVGYDDGAYFSRLFARRVGLPPSHFRQQHHR